MTDEELLCETTLELALLFEERSEDPCEHSQHQMSEIHEGPGKWLVRLAHNDCGFTSDFVICDKFFRTAMSGRVSIWCSKCRVDGLDPFDMYTVLGRKGVDF